MLHSWNNHLLSTEQNMTPLQLYCIGRNGNDTSSGSEDSYQTSVGTNSILTMATEAVEVRGGRSGPCGNVKAEMKRVSQLPSQSTGYDLYKMAAQMLGQHLTNHCMEHV